MQYLRLDLDHAGLAGHHDMAFLEGALQLHGAAGQRGERQRGFADQVENGEIVQALQLVAIFIPPDIRRAAVADDHDLCGASAGLANGALVGQADLDPAFDRAGKVFLPQIGFLVAAQAFAEGQSFIGIERKCEQTYHHALVGFRRVPCHGQCMVGVVVPVHIGDLERGFEYGCLDGHGVFCRVSGGAHSSREADVH